jgi:hypothetical protein
MNQVEQPRRVSRRGFLAGGAAAIVAVAVTGTTVLMDPSGAWAVELQSLKPEEAQALLKFVHDLFPHDQLAEVYYANAIAPLNDEAAKDPSAKRLLVDGISQLNRLAQAAGGAAYAHVSDEKIRVAAIKQLEGSPFFAKVYGTAVVSLYNQPKLWPKFGYEGPSSPLGGYLHRGFSDIDWL